MKSDMLGSKFPSSTCLSMVATVTFAGCAPQTPSITSSSVVPQGVLIAIVESAANSNGVSDLAAAYRLLRPYADAGVPLALSELALMYRVGIPGVISPDDCKAVELAVKSVEGGGREPSSLRIIGHAYLNGRGAPRDPTLATLYFWSAADGYAQTMKETGNQTTPERRALAGILFESARSDLLASLSSGIEFDRAQTKSILDRLDTWDPKSHLPKSVEVASCNPSSILDQMIAIRMPISGSSGSVEPALTRSPRGQPRCQSKGLFFFHVGDDWAAQCFLRNGNAPMREVEPACAGCRHRGTRRQAGPVRPSPCLLRRARIVQQLLLLRRIILAEQRRRRCH